MSVEAPSRVKIKSLNNLINAIRYGNKSLVYKILESGSVDITDKRLRAVPLHVACSDGDVDMVKALIARGAHVSAYNKMLSPFQSDPLIVACASIEEKTNIIQCLIDAGCDVNTRDIHGWTGLHWACARGNSANARMLIEAGADVNIITGDYLTALELASYGTNSELIRLLLQAGADLSRKAGEYISNLIAYRCTEGVELLYKACPQTTVRNPNVFQGKMRHFVQRISLLDPDPNRDYSNEDFQRVPVLHAVCSISFDPHQMLKKILRIEANIHQKDQFGLTCLQYVCSNLHVQSVKALLDYGVNPVKHGWTPLWKCFPRIWQDNAEQYLKLLKLLLHAGFKLDKESAIEFTESVKTSGLSRKDKVCFLHFLRDSWAVPCRLTSLCRRRVCQLLPVEVSVNVVRLANEIPRTVLQYLQYSDIEEPLRKEQLIN